MWGQPPSAVRGAKLRFVFESLEPIDLGFSTSTRSRAAPGGQPMAAVPTFLQAGFRTPFRDVAPAEARGAEAADWSAAAAPDVGPAGVVPSRDAAVGGRLSLYRLWFPRLLVLP